MPLASLTPNQPKTEQPPLPMIPAAREFPGCWTIYYRHGVNAQLSKNFFFDGSMFDARERAQRHCGIMGYKFNFIRPMLCDIEVEEGVQLGTHDNRTGLPLQEARR